MRQSGQPTCTADHAPPFTPSPPRHPLHRPGLRALSGCDGLSSSQAETLQHGPFEIIARSRRISTGSFPINGGNPFATQEATLFSRRWRSRTLGRVSMDMLAVDLGPVPQAAPGSEVTLWGRSSHGAILPIDEVAQAAGTIGYELMCALAPRVPVGVDPA